MSGFKGYQIGLFAGIHIILGRVPFSLLGGLSFFMNLFNFIFSFYSLHLIA